MQPSYQHTQKGTVILNVMALAGVFVVTVQLLTGNEQFAVTAIVLSLLAVAGWLFSSLTVTITADNLTWHFGPGWWRHSLARSDITGAKPVRTKWWYGFGIRRIPGGWLYNVSGLDAVAIERTDGKTVFIGTDQPVQLAKALET